MPDAEARVILLTGPSGCGKSHLARRSGLPLLQLDDFYKAGDDPSMPRHPGLGIVDWDDSDAWDSDSAMRCVRELCRRRRAEVPVYDIAADRATGSRVVDLDGHDSFVAEGLFAALLVERCRAEGLLADAIVMVRSPWKNFLRRFARDLSERRKPPLVLWHRGRLLMRHEAAVVEEQVDSGCRPLDARAARAALARAQR